MWSIVHPRLLAIKAQTIKYIGLQYKLKILNICGKEFHTLKTNFLIDMINILKGEKIICRYSPIKK